MSQRITPRDIAITALMIALVAVVTRFLIVPIGAGFFNLSDTAVYFTAFTFGPVIGFLAGGIGAALADLSAGYAAFAPLTFMAHGLQGLLAGWLTKRTRSPFAFMAAAVLVFDSLIVATNTLLVEWLTPMNRPILSSIVESTSLAVGIILLAVAVQFWKTDDPTILLVRAMVVGWAGGTIVMVGIYFVGEYFGGNLGWGGPAQAVFELPFNILQNVIGAAIAIPLSLLVRRAYPPLNRYTSQ